MSEKEDDLKEILRRLDSIEKKMDNQKPPVVIPFVPTVPVPYPVPVPYYDPPWRWPSPHPPLGPIWGLHTSTGDAPAINNDFMVNDMSGYLSIK